jgi:hypothetical protein
MLCSGDDMVTWAVAWSLLRPESGNVMGFSAAHSCFVGTLWEQSFSCWQAGMTLEAVLTDKRASCSSGGSSTVIHPVTIQTP